MAYVGAALVWRIGTFKGIAGLRREHLQLRIPLSAFRKRGQVWRNLLRGGNMTSLVEVSSWSATSQVKKSDVLGFT